MAQMSDRRPDEEPEATSEAHADEARLASMRRVKRMTIEQRIDLFERLVRDAAWACAARRVDRLDQ
jgi:hypothetical protein